MSESEHMFTEISEKLLKNSRTTLLDLDWFYDILDLDLKTTRATLLHANIQE